MTPNSFRSGSTQFADGVRVDRVLLASTCHMPNLGEDLSDWSWGGDAKFGLAWFFAYEEDCSNSGKPMPEWLLNLCIKARDQYGCNWVLLDPDAECIPGLPAYEHP